MLGNQFDNGGANNDPIGDTGDVGGLFGRADAEADCDGQVGLAL
jgi:hypothetical protein